MRKHASTAGQHQASWVPSTVMISPRFPSVFLLLHSDVVEVGHYARSVCMGVASPCISMGLSQIILSCR